MSAPDTNIEKQTRRHRPPLVGFAVVVVAVLAFVVLSQMAPENDATTPTPVSEITE